MVLHFCAGFQIYFPHLYPPLLSTLRRLAPVDSDVEILLCYKFRSLEAEEVFFTEFGNEFSIRPLLARRRRRRHQRGNPGADSDDAWQHYGSEHGTRTLICRRKRSAAAGENSPDEDMSYAEVQMLAMDL